MWQIAIIVTVTVVYSIIIVEINYMIVLQRTGTYQSGTFLVRFSEKRFILGIMQ